MLVTHESVFICPLLNIVPKQPSLKHEFVADNNNNDKNKKSDDDVNSTTTTSGFSMGK